MKTMEFCSGSMLHGFQGNPWNFPHAFSMVFPWFSHAFSTRATMVDYGLTIFILQGHAQIKYMYIYMYYEMATVFIKICKTPGRLMTQVCPL